MSIELIGRIISAGTVLYAIQSIAGGDIRRLLRKVRQR